jgi:hypothetical protein
VIIVKENKKNLKQNNKGLWIMFTRWLNGLQSLTTIYFDNSMKIELWTNKGFEKMNFVVATMAISSFDTMFSYVFALTLWPDYTHGQDSISLHGKKCVNCKKI